MRQIGAEDPHHDHALIYRKVPHSTENDQGGIIMKKKLSLTLAVMLAMIMLVMPAIAKDITVIKYGVLTMLNITEDEMVDYMKAAWRVGSQGVKQWDTDTPFSGPPTIPVLPKNECIFYDTLDAMVMGLSAGEIGTMVIYNTVADYLCSVNDGLFKTAVSGNESDNSFFDSLMSENLTTNDFAFMMMEGNEALRDEFNSAIAAIRGDGTLEQLTADHINAVIRGNDITPVEMPVIEGAETIRVAITGALPPMDYIAPDGTPAGFNTALLAEISQRINKNIELVQVDSIGRAAALASGTVDAVFWTRTNNASNTLAKASKEEQAAAIEEYRSKVTEDESGAFERVLELVDLANIGSIDMPMGTIITDSYYSDEIVPVMLKSTAFAMMGK